MSSEYDPAANRRRFLQYLAASPLHGRGRRFGLRRNVPAEDDGARSADVGAAPVGPSHQVAEGGHQRLRSRAGLPAERAAGAFRLHGLGHRRRSDACAPTARASSNSSSGRGGCVDVSKVDMSVDILGTQILLADRRARRSAASARSTTMPKSGVARAAKAGDHLQILSHHDIGHRRGRHQGARRADLDAALRHQQVGGGGGHHQARRERRLHGARRHRRSQRRPQPGNAGPAAARRHARLQRLPRPLELRRTA